MIANSDFAYNELAGTISLGVSEVAYVAGIEKRGFLWNILKLSVLR